MNLLDGKPGYEVVGELLNEVDRAASDGPRLEYDSNDWADLFGAEEEDEDGAGPSTLE